MTDAALVASPDLLLPYGLAPDGRLVSVAQVERGLACGCRCPRCAVASSRGREVSSDTTSRTRPR
jgi:hypothetical protein